MALLNLHTWALQEFMPPLLHRYVLFYRDCGRMPPRWLYKEPLVTIIRLDSYQPDQSKLTQLEHQYLHGSRKFWQSAYGWNSAPANRTRSTTGLEYLKAVSLQ